MTILKILAYFVAGFLEWGIATFRTWYVSRGKTKAVMLIVFCEELLLVGVTAFVINNPQQWWLLLFAAFGGALGAGLCLNISKGRKK